MGRDSCLDRGGPVYMRAQLVLPEATRPTRGRLGVSLVGSGNSKALEQRASDAGHHHHQVGTTARCVACCMLHGLGHVWSCGAWLDDQDD